MLEIIRGMLTDRLNGLKEERDKLLKEQGVSLLSTAGKETSLPPMAMRLICYVDAYVDILNRLDHVDAMGNQNMTVNDKRWSILMTFLNQMETEWDPLVPDLTNPDTSPEVMAKVKDLAKRLPFNPKTFPLFLMVWFLDTYHPPTPRFDPKPPESDAPSPPEPEAA